MASRYHDSRLSLGKATSLVPSISGRKKLPKTPGIDGIRKKNTMITPCAVKARL